MRAAVREETFYVTRVGHLPTEDNLVAAGSYAAMVAAGRLLGLPVQSVATCFDATGAWASYAQVRDGQPPLSWAVAVRNAHGSVVARLYYKTFRLGDPPPPEMET